MSEKIDFVIPWVNGGDPRWLKERALYDQNALEQGVDDARFRDWGTLKYALRSIEQYADWVGTVYLITWGHLPKWLDVSHPKLKVICHEDYIPPKYLPTFSSHVIELNMHRIPGLSEQFVYFNDDMLFVNPVVPEDFFKDGKPAGCGVLHIHCVTKQNMIYTICNNNTELINEHFDLKTTLKDKARWFNPRYGLKNLLETTVLSVCPRFPGIHNTHLPNAYLKSTFEEVWAREPEILDETSSHKFREKTDVNQWLMLNWQLAANNFFPVSSKERGVLVDFEKDGTVSEVLERCHDALHNPKYKMICINDGDSVGDYENLKAKVTAMLEEKYPNPSRFELPDHSGKYTGTPRNGSMPGAETGGSTAGAGFYDASGHENLTGKTGVQGADFAQAGMMGNGLKNPADSGSTPGMAVSVETIRSVNEVPPRSEVGFTVPQSDSYLNGSDWSTDGSAGKEPSSVRDEFSDYSHDARTLNGEEIPGMAEAAAFKEQTMSADQHRGMSATGPDLDDLNDSNDRGWTAGAGNKSEPGFERAAGSGDSGNAGDPSPYANASVSSGFDQNRLDNETAGLKMAAENPDSEGTDGGVRNVQLPAAGFSGSDPVSAGQDNEYVNCAAYTGSVSALPNPEIIKSGSARDVADKIHHARHPEPMEQIQTTQEVLDLLKKQARQANLAQEVQAIERHQALVESGLIPEHELKK